VRSDRFGPPPRHRYFVLWTDSGLWFYALAPSLRGAVFGRLISGITTSNVPPHLHMAPNSPNPAERAKPFGYQRGVWTWIRDWAGGGGWLGQRTLVFLSGSPPGSESTKCTFGNVPFTRTLPPERRAEIRLAYANPLWGTHACVRMRNYAETFRLVFTLYSLAHNSAPVEWA